MQNRNTPIAVEGFPFILGSLVLTVILALLAVKFHPGFFVPAVVSLLLTLFIVFFFRNPQRRVPADKNAVVPPADGMVISAGKVREPHTGQEMEKVSIFMSVFNVHVNRAPVSGRVLDSFYTKGKFLDVRHELATFENEQQGLVMEANGGQKLVVVQVAGLIARRIVCYAKIGDALDRGMRYGLIRFGSRLDVYQPVGTQVKVKLGERTVAGETIMGILP